MTWKLAIAGVLGIAAGIGAAVLLRRWRAYGEPDVTVTGDPGFVIP